MAAEERPPGWFRTSLTPWLVGAGGLLVYLLTFNHWISLQSFGPVARTAGWLWRPQFDQPLSFLLFAPFRLLPETWLPVALNMFGVLCAALVLVLLARSVILLPHDISRDNLLPNVALPRAFLTIRTAWIPPLLAAIVCGLQLSFWEQATSASSEMLDLLLLAYVIRCLLEFRVAQKERWLAQAAFTYGAGMANSWALVGLFPVFLAAILRLKGYGPFRERRFLIKMLAWGILGLSLYLLLPTINSITSHGQTGFWTTLKAHLKSQREILGYWRKPAFRALAFASLLPVVVLSIRWRSHTVQSGDDTRLGVFLTKAAVHFVHALFFGCSIWLALDPKFSPRHLGFGTSLLTFYYLSALVLGYCAGYFLLFGSRPAQTSSAPRTLRQRLAELELQLPSWLVTSLAVAVLGGAVWALLARNLEQIRFTNGNQLRELAADLYADLPNGRSVVLGDEPAELLLLRAFSAGEHNAKNALFVDVPSLASPEYQVFLARRSKDRWPVAMTNNSAAPAPGKVLTLIAAFAAREPIVYLHPSLGPIFELFEQHPNGALQRLAPRPGTSQNSQAAVGEPGGESDNQRLWEKRWSGHLQLLAKHTREKTNGNRGFISHLLTLLYMTPEPNPTAMFTGSAYSRRLNDWGVQEQLRGKSREAKVWFQRALELNPANITARINLDFQELREQGAGPRLEIAKTQNRYSESFAKYPTWREIINANGPVDEPSFLFRGGRVLLQNGEPRQAQAAFARAAELDPAWPSPKLWLAQTCNQLSDFAGAHRVLEPLTDALQPQDGPGLSRLLECRVAALQGLGRTNDAQQCLERFVNDFNKHEEVLTVAAELYSQNGQHAQALDLLEELLKREPNRQELLSRKGLIQLRLGDYAGAIAALTTAISLAPRNDDARFCRAVAYLGAGQLEAARADYQELLPTVAHWRNALFGLGTVAWRQQDTNLAINYYQRYLSNGLVQTRQDRLAAERLNELQQAQR